MNRPVVALTVFFIAGILIGETTGLNGSAALLLAALAAAAAAAGYLLAWRHNSRLLLVVFLLLGLSLARLWVAGSETALINYDGQRVVLTGRVVAEPDVRPDKVYYLLQAQQLTKSGKTDPVSGTVRLQLKETDRVFAYGDLLTAAGLLARPDPAGNPGLFDYRTYLERQGIRVVLMARGDQAVRKIGAGGSNPLQKAALLVKQKMSAAATHSLSPAQAAVLNGLIFGVQGLIDSETRRAFSETGVVHILSVSGLHVGLVLAGLLALLRLLRLPPVWTAPLATPLLLTYALMTGLNPAVLRATIMALLLVWAHHFGRDQDWPTTLALAALIILIRNPLQIYHPGFQLSFAATWGILYLGPVLTSAGLKLFRAPPGRAVRLALQALAVTLAAQLATMPLVAWYYNLASPVSLIANLMAVPLTGLIMLLGLLAAFLGLVWLPLAALVNVSTGLVLDLFLALIAFCQALPGAVIFLSTPPALLAAAWYAGLLAVVKVHSGDCSQALVQFLKKWAPVGAALAAALVLLWWPWRPGSDLIVHFIDVGQGDSILVQTPGGRNMLIDAGGRPGEFNTGTGAGDQVVEPYLRKTGVRRLDILMLSHPHEDHSGGAVWLARRFPVKMALVTPAGAAAAPGPAAADSHQPEGAPAAYTALLDHLAARDIPVETARAGDRIALDSKVKIEVLSPQAAAAGPPGAGLNNSSLIIKISYGRRSLILTGDAELEEQRELLEGEADLTADVLKAPHHGSRSLLPDLIEQVQPAVAVISVGAYNTFGHPAQTTLDLLQAAGAAVYRTDLDGAVIIRTDGHNLEITSGRKNK
ncbi:MAG: DNA internalization-related competence protein ComEC/Rec2 [Desulfotomaculaceae bacterium]|nr:DNA internalization-related competence protein ComEC/Rec2 [Desulfotomaculaceae bacterium]